MFSKLNETKERKLLYCCNVGSALTLLIFHASHAMHADFVVVAVGRKWGHTVLILWIHIYILVDALGDLELRRTSDLEIMYNFCGLL